MKKTINKLLCKYLSHPKDKLKTNEIYVVAGKEITCERCGKVEYKFDEAKEVIR